MRLALASLVLVALVISGCSCSSACNGALCGPCSDTLVVTVSGAGPTTVATLEGGTCAYASGVLTCRASLAVGAHDLALVLDGASRRLSVTIAPAPAGCCTCPPTASMTVELGAPRDGGVPAGDASQDASALDTGALDAGALDAGLACDPSVVRFSPSGALVVGQLCDDVFACVASAGDATALQAVAPDFTCDTMPAAGCTGITCHFSPSLLDQAELAEVCAVTELTPRPSVLCMIYL